MTVDLYHSFSADGGVTWKPERRVTSGTSQPSTDNFQWGDYKGMSLTLEPNFDIATTAEAQAICRGQALETVTVNVTPRNGFSGPIPFSLGD